MTRPDPRPSAQHDPFIDAASDRCVLCGMCIPQCPTYQLHHSENESPRGRVSLLRAVNAGQLRPDKALLRSINHCLECGRCETICPSAVPYRALMDAGRAQLRPRQSWGWRLRNRLLLWATASPARLRRLLGWTRVTPLRQLARLLPKPLRTLLPSRPGPRAEVVPPANITRGTVLLLRGCANSAFDPEQHSATQALLGQQGYPVVTLDEEACCGALAQHSGARELARTLAQRNLRGVTAEMTAILHPASACAKHLQVYQELLGKSAAPFSERARDLSEFFIRTIDPQGFTLSHDPKRVLLHSPCSQRALGPELYHWLQQIAGLEVVRLDEGAGCCGAAGSYMLEQPQMARQLRQTTLATIADEHDYDYIVSGNIGCQLHLQQGLASLEVIHPLVLLHRHSQYEAEP